MWFELQLRDGWGNNKEAHGQGNRSGGKDAPFLSAEKFEQCSLIVTPAPVALRELGEICVAVGPHCVKGTGGRDSVCPPGDLSTRYINASSFDPALSII